MAPGATVSRTTLTAQLVEAMRTDILSGELPPLMRLRAAEIRIRYRVSPTPFREAIQRLAADGLVESDPRAGARVAPLTAKELYDTYQVRLLLEPVALKLSMRSATDEWRQSLTSAIEALRKVERGGSSRSRSEAFVPAHRRFHALLFEACGSPWLVRFLLVLARHSERYWLAARRRPHRLPSLPAHEAIYEAVMIRNEAQALTFLRTHLMATVEQLGEVLSDPEP